MASNRPLQFTLGPLSEILRQRTRTMPKPQFPYTISSFINTGYTVTLFTNVKITNALNGVKIHTFQEYIKREYFFIFSFASRIYRNLHQYVQSDLYQFT